MARTARPLRHLGQLDRLPASPGEAVLDRVANPHADTNYVARFTAPEFTTLCPVTGQPDFAHLVIDYVPGKWLVESKSLKLYLGELPQRRRLPRGLHRCDRQAARRVAHAEMAAHRRLLVPARRHADRRVLADRAAAGRRVAARPGRCALSRAGLAASIGGVVGAATGASRRCPPSAPPRRRPDIVGSAPPWAKP